MSAAPVTPHDLAMRAQAAYRRGYRAWAADPSEAPVVSLPLHPPTERAVLANSGSARAWVEQWRKAESTLPMTVEWGLRRWPSVGTQSVPERVALEGADALAEVAGLSGEWRLVCSRCGDLRAALVPLVVDPGLLTPVLRRQAGAIAALPARDFEVLADVVAWLAANPVSGRRVRELPIRGIDTKWLQGHRSLVESLVLAVTGGSSLGLLPAPSVLRFRILDPSMAVGGLTDVSAPVGQIATLTLEPRSVLVTENLETLLALPPLARTVAFHGGGFGVVALTEVPWACSRTLVYWGDLDSHGFSILHAARSAELSLTSVLMDEETLLGHRDLWVDEPQPNGGTFSTLTGGELATLQRLRAEGSPRLEQERIPWDYATSRLRQALGTVR